MSTHQILGLLFLIYSPCLGWSQKSADSIQLNQTGFYPDGPKVAVVRGAQAGEFYVIDRGDKDTVFRGRLSGPCYAAHWPGPVRIADFSALLAPGRYVIRVPCLGSSYPFEISADVHKGVAKASLKGFYFQRAGVGLPAGYAGKWARSAGHPDKNVLIHASTATEKRPEGSVISSPGGWYDAGDYNKYIVNSGITIGTLLSAYEDFPDYFRRQRLNMPENANRIPDLLDEALWNLRWMLTMQDPDDRGVYHKLTAAKFEGMVMPQEAVATRYVVRKSTAAALDFAAVMAQAARVFAGFEKELPGLADSCLQAARQAWEWAVQHPEKIYDQDAMNKQYAPPVTTGPYGDRDLADEFIWAACELYITTGDDRYYKVVDILPDEQMPLPSWRQVRLLGYYSFLRFRQQLPEAVQEDVEQIRQQLIRLADEWIAGMQQHPYRVVMGITADDFVWGSNSVAANQGIALVQAYRLTSERKYLGAALANLDYLLGRNATGYSFLTGFGSKTPMHIHHRPSEADGIDEPVPGLLAGGPNPGMQDGCRYPSDRPAAAYVDDACSYASNEITINWNAPLVYLASALEALQYEAGYTKR